MQHQWKADTSVRMISFCIFPMAYTRTCARSFQLFRKMSELQLFISQDGYEKQEIYDVRILQAYESILCASWDGQASFQGGNHEHI